MSWKTRSLITLAWLLATAAVLWALSPVLPPFVAALVLAYVFSPLVARLEQRGWSRTVGVLLVLLGLVLLGLLLLALVLPIVLQQVQAVVQHLPEAQTFLLQRVAPQLARLLDLPALNLIELQGLLAQHTDELRVALQKVLPQLAAGGQALLGWLVQLALVPLLMFFMLRDWPLLVRQGHALIPPRWSGPLLRVLTDIDLALGEYLRGQLLVMLCMSGFYGLALSLVGLHSGLAVGVLSGLLVFVPYLGFACGFGLAMLSALVQGDGTVLLLTLGCYGAGQVIEGLLTPLVVGDRIGLHPVAALFAVLALGQLLGLVGVLLAMPLAAMLVVLVRHARRVYFASAWYRAERGVTK